MITKIFFFFYVLHLNFWNMKSVSAVFKSAFESYSRLTITIYPLKCWNGFYVLDLIFSFKHVFERYTERERERQVLTLIGHQDMDKFTVMLMLYLPTSSIQFQLAALNSQKQPTHTKDQEITRWEWLHSWSGINFENNNSQICQSHLCIMVKCRDSICVSIKLFIHY